MAKEYEITDEDAPIVAAMAGVPWYREYELVDDVAVDSWGPTTCARRQGCTVDLRVRGRFVGGYDFLKLSPLELRAVVCKLEQVWKDADMIRTAMEDYMAAKASCPNFEPQEIDRSTSYEFEVVPGVKYHVIFTFCNGSASVHIATGDYPFGKCDFKYGRSLGEDEITTKEAAQAHLKVYLMAKAKGESLL